MNSPLPMVVSVIKVMWKYKKRGRKSAYITNTKNVIIMVQKVKNSMGLVNIPNELLEQVSKNGMSMLFGGENFGGVDLNESLNNGLHCNVINHGSNCDTINDGTNCSSINNGVNCASVNNRSVCHIIRH